MEQLTDNLHFLGFDIEAFDVVSNLRDTGRTLTVKG
jgi:hypothetical protein